VALSAHSGDADLGIKQIMKRGMTEHDDHLGSNNGDLA
jgi:hypothetical protein